MFALQSPVSHTESHSIISILTDNDSRFYSKSFPLFFFFNPHNDLKVWVAMAP